MKTVMIKTNSDKFPVLQVITPQNSRSIGKDRGRALPGSMAADFKLCNRCNESGFQGVSG